MNLSFAGCLQTGPRFLRWVHLLGWFLMITSLHAQTRSGDWEYTQVGKNATLLRYYGSDSSVIVPERITGLLVTELDPLALWISGFGDRVAHLNLPATLVSFDTSLFGLSGLQTVSVAPANPHFSSLGGILYDKAQTRLLRCPKKWAGDLVIPNTVTRIDAEAFGGCGALTRVVVPDGVTEVGADAFSGTEGLISLTFPAALLPSIRQSCQRAGRIDPVTHLRFLTLNGSVLISGWDTGWSQKIDLEIPQQIEGNPVTAIGREACQGMPLARVSIPSGVSWIGDGPFGHCYFLGTIDVAESNAFFRSVDGVLLDKTETTLLQFPAGREGRFIVPARVDTLASQAFRGATLREVVLPEGILRVGSAAFYGCSQLEQINIPSRLEVIEPETFAWCGSLETLRIPDSVSVIEARAFYRSGLRRILLGDGLTRIGDEAFDNRSYHCKGGPPCYGPPYWIYGDPIDLFFLGNAPQVDQPFGYREVDPADTDLSYPPRIIHRVGASGWTSTLGGMTTRPWNGDPMLLTQPQPIYGYGGAVGHLSMEAFGVEPIHFQWQHNTADVPDATNAFVAFNPLQPGVAGDWRVVVSNAWGSATSQVASVTVRLPAPGSYEAAAVALSPLAYWPLDETEGDATWDFVTGTSGFYSGTPLLGQSGATANTGHSIGLNGRAAVIAPHHPAWDFGAGNFTIAAWIHPTAFAVSGIAAQGGWYRGWQFDFSVWGEGVLGFETSLESSGEQDAVRTLPGVVTLNEWQHVVVSCRRDPDAGLGLNSTNHGWTRIYRNGVLVASGDIRPGNLSTWNAPLTLGSVSSEEEGDSFPGLLDDVALFGEALSSDQIAALYAAAVRSGPHLQITSSAGKLVLTWSTGVLQSAAILGKSLAESDWVDLDGATSPFSPETISESAFYRIRAP